MARLRAMSPAIQLFPFLAVLVCVMGTLIFLLLVINKQLQQSKHSEREEAAILDTLNIATPEEPNRSAESVRVKSSPTTPRIDDEDHPWIPEFVDDRLYQEEQKRILSELNQQLQEQSLAWQHQAALLNQAIAEKRGEHDRLRQITRSQREGLLAVRQNQVLYEQQIEMLQHALRENQQDLAQLRRHCQRLSERQDIMAPKASTFCIVTYDSLTGTTRRPIMIECTSRGYRFWPENVEINIYDLQGSTSSQNPLIICVRALWNYWRSQEELYDHPYLLLIVRPDGVMTYYVAQQLLSELHYEQGYELVPTHVELTFPPADPEATQVCRLALERYRAMPVRERGTSALVPLPATLSDNHPSPRSTVSSPPQASQKSGEDNAWRKLLTSRSSIGERTWENVERFEGQEYRQGNSIVTPEQSKTMPGGKLTSNQPRRITDSHAMVGRRQEHPLEEEPRLSTARRQSSRSDSSKASANRLQPDYLLGTTNLRHRWGPSAPGASIGLEHDIELQLTEEGIYCDDSLVAAWDEADSMIDLTHKLLTRLERRAQSWQNPPDGFFWVPHLKVHYSLKWRNNAESLSAQLRTANMSFTMIPEGTQPE